MAAHIVTSTVLHSDAWKRYRSFQPQPYPLDGNGWELYFEAACAYALPAWWPPSVPFVTLEDVVGVACEAFARTA